LEADEAHDRRLEYEGGAATRPPRYVASNLEQDNVFRSHDAAQAAYGPRWPYAVLAYVFVALALLGVVVPGLPTTPFVLLAAWAASRGSRRLHDWLVAHRHLGPPLAAWREEGAVSPRAKRVAIGFLVLSWATLLWRGTAPWLLAVLAVFFIAVGTFVGTRPPPRG
jgi:uncharacterized membrane protein YbaN (DUF454 family)